MDAICVDRSQTITLPGLRPELRNRGVRGVLIGQIWPQALVQTCVVHLIRNSMRYASWKDRKTIAAALRPIYTAARLHLQVFRW